MVAAGWSFAIIQSDGKYGLDKRTHAQTHTHTYTCMHPHPERVGQINSYQFSSGERPPLLFVPPANHLSWKKKREREKKTAAFLKGCRITFPKHGCGQCSAALRNKMPLGKIIPTEFPSYLQAVDTRVCMFTRSLLWKPHQFICCCFSTNLYIQAIQSLRPCRS